MNYLKILFVNIFLVVAINCKEQSLPRDKLKTKSGFTTKNAQCKQSYKIINPPKSPSIELVEVTCDIQKTFCTQYTANIELEKDEDGSKYMFEQNVACVYIGDTVNDGGVNSATGMTLLIIVGLSLVAGVVILIFLNVRLRRRLRGLESNTTEVTNANYSGTVNQGLDLEEVKEVK